MVSPLTARSHSSVNPAAVFLSARHRAHISRVPTKFENLNESEDKVFRSSPTGMSPTCFSTNRLYGMYMNCSNGGFGWRWRWRRRGRRVGRKSGEGRDVDGEVEKREKEGGWSGGGGELDGWVGDVEEEGGDG